MKFVKTLVLTLVLLSLLAVYVFGDGPMGLDLEEFYLDNGLKVILVKRDVLPVVSIQLWYKVGAGLEVDGKSGIAHFLEHMAFKGTKNLKPGEFSRIIRSLGGEDNAATSWDYTMYYVDIPSKHTVRILRMLKEIMFDVVFDEREFQSEKKVILEERRMRYEDDPFGQFFEDFLGNSFRKISYRRPVIGWEEDIRNLTLQDLISFYNTFYSPKNAVLIVVGNIEKDILKKEIREIFNESSKNFSQKEAEVEKVDEFGSGKVEFKTIRKDANSKSVIVGFRTQSYRASPKEAVTFEVLSYILADGRKSKLYKDLVVNKKLASSVNGGTMMGKYPFLTYFFLVLNPDVEVERAKKELLESLNLAVKGGITDDEIITAKKKIKARMVYEFEKNHGIASSLGWSEVVLGNYKELEKFMTIVDEITKEDIIKAFEKYFSENNLIIGSLESS
ncbi:MAG: pitrilysin family protein [Brevinematia bacterium]